MGWADGAVEVISPEEIGKSGVLSPAKSGDDDFYSQKLRSGFAAGVGNYLDAPYRLLQLGKAGLGMTFAPDLMAKIKGSTRAQELPEVSTRSPATEYIMGLLGGRHVEPQNLGQKVLGGAVEGLGAVAGSGSPFMPSAVVGSIGRQALTGGAAGAGAESAGAMTGDNPYAKLFGGLLGGVAAPSLLSGRVQMAKDIASSGGRMADNARTNAAPYVETIVNKQIRDSVQGTPQAAENISEALRLRSQIPGFNPSVAESAGAPGVLDMQRRYALTHPETLNKELARQAANKQAVEDFYSRTAPRADQPSIARSDLNRALASEESALASEARQVATQAPRISQSQAGAKISELASAERAAARPQMKAAYDEAFAAAQGKTIDIAPVVAKIEEILGEKLAQIKPESAPLTVRKIQGLVKQQGDKTPEEAAYLASVLGGELPSPQTARAQVTLKDADEISKALNADISSASRSMDPIASQRLRALGQAKGALDEAIAGSEVPQTAKDLYGAAKQKYSTEYAPRFKEGANQLLFKDKSTNEPRILPEQVVGEYFKPDASGGISRASQFGALFGKNAEALSVAKRGILDIYRQKVLDPVSGALKPEAHAQFLKDYGRTIDEFKGKGVDVTGDLAKIGKDIQTLSDAAARLKDVAGSLRYDTVHQLADAALGSTKVMANATMRMGAEAKNAFARTLMDKAMESGTAAGLSSFLEKHGATLKMAVPQEQLSNLRDIGKALEIIERAPIRGALAAAGPDILKNATGVSMATVWAQYRATTGGRQGAATMAFNLAAPVMTRLQQTQFTQIMETALHDPNTASNLRNFLLARSAPEANRWGERLMDAARTANALKGPILKYAIGTPSYKPNLARSGAAIEATIQDEGK
jgi:hypothetical protein